MLIFQTRFLTNFVMQMSYQQSFIETSSYQLSIHVFSTLPTGLNNAIRAEKKRPLIHTNLFGIEMTKNWIV